MSVLQPPILSTSVVKTEPPTVIKNEPSEPEIMNIDIDEDIKNIDIVSHPLSEDLIKSETVQENIFESKHSEYVEAQAFVKAENVSLVQIENTIKCEKTDDTDDGNGTWHTGQEAVEVQGIHTKHPKKTDYARCHKTLESNLWKKEKKKIKVIKAPVIQFSCDHCDFKTRYFASLKMHNIIHLKPEESQYFYCSHCSFKTKYKYNLSHHQASRHCKNVEIEQKQKRFRCDHCDYKTRYSTHLKRHNLIHLKPEESQYFYCDHCSFKARHKQNLTRHIFKLHKKNVESKQKKYSCDRCDYKTQSRDSLKSHNLIHLKPEDTQYFYCSHCSFKTKYKNSLSSHQVSRRCKNVEIQKRIPCPVLESDQAPKAVVLRDTSPQPSTSKEIYTAQYMFRCDHCDYKAQRRYHLKMHNLIHLKPEERQYFYCDHCSFISKHKSYLRHHILRHFQNEEVKFCCYICDFMTLERELIISHIKTHSEVRNKSKINEGN